MGLHESATALENWGINFVGMTQAHAEHVADYSRQKLDVQAYLLDPHHWYYQVWDRATVTMVLQALEAFVASSPTGGVQLLTLIEAMQEWLEMAEVTDNDT